jgi:hypothetical protein
MNAQLPALVAELDALLPGFATRRNQDGLANDCYEAAWYWRDLGRWVLENNTRVNYPERARGEFMLLAQLRELLAKRSPQDQDDFRRVIDAGEEVLNIVATVQPPKDGHLGFLRIVREQFDFLRLSGFKTVSEEPTEIRFSSGDIYLELSHSVNPWLSCSFGPDAPSPPSYWIHDLLYLNGDERYRTLPERLELNSESATADWFAFLAECFRKYGRSILSNEEGAVKQIAAAQAKRDGEYVREMELKLGPSSS